MLLDRTIDLCAEVLYGQASEQVILPTERLKEVGGRGEGGKNNRICTFFKEAIFIASVFFGAIYRFPFFVVEDDEAGRVAFCFAVFIPFNLP